MSSAAVSDSATLLREAEEAQRLLRRGWRQLGRCPSGCGAQLLGHQGEVFCVRCQQWFSPEDLDKEALEAGDPEDEEEDDEDGFISLASSANFQAIKSELQKDMQRTASATADPAEAEKQRKQETAAKHFDTVSNELGQRMLAGWTLLGDHCAKCNCPLMRKPQSQETECIGCNLAKDGSAASAKAGSAASVVPQSEDDEAEADPQAKAKKNGLESSSPASSAPDKVVSLIGERLLEGWALLAEVCPTGCLTPLVRDLDQQMWCLRCNARAVSQKDVDAGLVKVTTQSPITAAAAMDDSFDEAEAQSTTGSGDDDDLLFSPAKASPATVRARRRSTAMEAARPQRELDFASVAAPPRPLVGRPLPAASQRKRRRSVVALDSETEPAANGGAENNQGEAGAGPLGDPEVARQLAQRMDRVTALAANSLLDRIESLCQRQAAMEDDEAAAQLVRLIPSYSQALGSVADLRKEFGF